MNLLHPKQVYNPSEDTWTTPFSFPRDMITSDLASFISGDYLYYLAGYDSSYVARSETYRVKIKSGSNYTPETMSPLNSGRGDVHAAVEGDNAYVTGGFTHVNNYCNALNTVDMYDIKNNRWDTIDNLNTERADKSLVNLNE